MQTSFEKVSPEIKRIFHGYKRHFTPESIQIYRHAFERLKNIKPELTSMKLHVKHHDVSGYYDEDVLKKMKEEAPETWEGAYGIGLTPWKYVLSMEIDSKSQDWLSPEAIVANCLDEMLYYGLEEDWDLFLDNIKEQEAPEDEYANPNIVIHTMENGVATIFKESRKFLTNIFRVRLTLRRLLFQKPSQALGILHSKDVVVYQRFSYLTSHHGARFPLKILFPILCTMQIIYIWMGKKYQNSQSPVM